MTDSTRSAWDLEPGDAVAVPSDTHGGKLDQYGIVTNYRCREGLPYVISADLESGEITEDTWEEFTGGADARVAELRGGKHWTTVVKTARSRLGQRWDTVRSTSDNFVRWAHGLPQEHPQLVGGVVKVAVAAGLTLGAALILKAFVGRR